MYLLCYTMIPPFATIYGSTTEGFSPQCVLFSALFYVIFTNLKIKNVSILNEQQNKQTD